LPPNRRLTRKAAEKIYPGNYAVDSLRKPEGIGRDDGIADGISF
jgi:hypothetical protein